MTGVVRWVFLLLGWTLLGSLLYQQFFGEQGLVYHMSEAMEKPLAQYYYRSYRKPRVELGTVESDLMGVKKRGIEVPASFGDGATDSIEDVGGYTYTTKWY